MGSPVVYFEINGGDADRLVAFYTELFGWRVRREAPPAYRVMDTGSERGISGGIGECAEPEGQWVTFYVEVPDADAALRRAGELGGRVLVPPIPARGGPTIAAFADPEGHVVGLVEAPHQ